MSSLNFLPIRLHIQIHFRHQTQMIEAIPVAGGVVYRGGNGPRGGHRDCPTNRLLNRLIRGCGRNTEVLRHTSI